MAKRITREQVKRLVRPVNQKLVDKAILHAHFINRYSNTETNKILVFLNREVFPDLVYQIQRRLAVMKKRGFDKGPWTTEHLRELLATSDAIFREGLGEAGASLRQDLKAWSVSEAEHERAVLAAETSPWNIEFSTPNVQTLHSIVTSEPFQGKVLNKWWSGVEASAKDGIRRQVTQGIAEGQTIPQIVRRLVGTQAAAFGDGELGKIRRNAEAVARTAINHVSTQARESIYEANSDVIAGVQYVATLDARTTEICMSLDGRVFGIREGPRPPMHFNCRSTTVPALKSWKQLGINLREAPLGTRATLDGQVSERVTYSQWLKSQPQAVQVAALGKAKAELFSKGMPIDKFVNDKGQTVPVKVLEKMRIPSSVKSIRTGGRSR